MHSAEQARDSLEALEPQAKDSANPKPQHFASAIQCMALGQGTQSGIGSSWTPDAGAPLVPTAT